MAKNPSLMLCRMPWVSWRALSASARAARSRSRSRSRSPRAKLVRGDRRLDALRAQPFPEAPAVVGLVGDQLFGTLLWPAVRGEEARRVLSVFSVCAHIECAY